MKIKEKALTILAALGLTLSTVPSVNSYAVTYDETPQKTENSAEFAVLMWKENKDGTIAITGCVPFTSPRISDYPTTNLVSIFIFNGNMQIPSHICDKEVTKISGVNLTKNLNVKYVTINENLTDISKTAFSDDVYITTTEKEFKLSPVYYRTR